MLLGFTRALRSAGVPVTLDRAHGFLRATAIRDAGDPVATYAAGRATLCAGPDDLRRYDQVFEAWFGSTARMPVPPVSLRTVTAVSTLPETEPQPGEGEGEDAGEVVRAQASDIETLRHRDVADLSAAEQERVAALIARLAPRAPTKRTPRQDPWRRGRVDAHRPPRPGLQHLAHARPIDPVGYEPQHFVRVVEAMSRLATERRHERVVVSRVDQLGVPAHLAAHEHLGRL